MAPRPSGRAESDARAKLERSTDRCPDALRCPRRSPVSPTALRCPPTLLGVRTLLGVPDALVGEEGETVTDGLGADETQGPGVAGLAEEALAGPEHDRVDRQP